MHQFARLAIALALPAVAGAQQSSFSKQHVTFPSGSLTLAGYAFKPAGPGPFPLVVWNHGSEHFPDRGPQFDSVAAVFVPAGYAVFAPMRRGHSGVIAAGRMQVHLLETEQLDDQLAGLAFAKALPFVDTTRIVVAGCSYGGIQTLLGAEAGAYKAAFSISPAALSWRANPLLQQRMVKAIDRIDVPVRIIQPPKDASLEPARVLRDEAKRAHKALISVTVYPATMPESEQVHCFGGAKGMHNWAKEAVSFFDGVARR